VNVKPKPNRTTASFTVYIDPTVISKLRFDADARGFKTMRQYIETLAVAGLAPGWKRQAGSFTTAGQAVVPTVLGHRLVQAIEAVRDRVDAGEPVEALLPDLRALRVDVERTLNVIRVSYLAEVDAHEARIGR
jgi:hypothetical protein